MLISGFLALDSRSLGKIDIKKGASAMVKSDGPEGNRVSGKMRFHGYHQQKTFFVEPSGRHVWWIGVPIFTFDGPKVCNLYVLGDIYGLIARLKGQDC